MSQIVDPFIPQRSPARRAKRQIVHTPSQDGVIHRAPPNSGLPQQYLVRKTAAQAAAEQPTNTRSAQRVKSKQPHKKQKRLDAKLWCVRICQALIVLGLVAAILFLPRVLYGELAIATYAILAWLLRLSSRITFALALCALIAVVGIQAGSSESSLPTVLAIYSFLLLVAGTVSLALESRGSHKIRLRQN